MRDDTPPYERPVEPCPLFVPGEPEASPLPSGHLCGGMDGQPCRRCKHMALGVRGMAEFFEETMGDGRSVGRRTDR